MINYYTRQNKKKGFTLIEVLIVIAIITMLGSLFMGNVFSAIARGRDSRRKLDLKTLAEALEFYYNDLRSYPNNLPAADTPFTHPINSNVIYIQKTPADPRSRNSYCYESVDGSQYKIATNLENPGDTDILASPTNCGGVDYNYGITSPNINL